LKDKSYIITTVFSLRVGRPPATGQCVEDGEDGGCHGVGVRAHGDGGAGGRRGCPGGRDRRRGRGRGDRTDRRRGRASGGSRVLGPRWGNRREIRYVLIGTSTHKTMMHAPQPYHDRIIIEIGHNVSYGSGCTMTIRCASTKVLHRKEPQETPATKRVLVNVPERVYPLRIVVP